MTYLTETGMKPGDTLFFCEVSENRDDSGELRYHQKEVGIIAKICPKRLYITPSSEEKRFQKQYINGSHHAEAVLLRSEVEHISFLHIAYYASSGEDLEKYAIRAVTILRERVRWKVRKAAEELKQLMKPVGGIEAAMNGGTGAHGEGSADPLPAAPQREMKQQALCLTLPDGTVLRARPSEDPLYPGLSLAIVHEGGAADERLCFVELNRDRNNRLYVGAYNAAEDDCVYYKPYHPGTDEEDDE